MYDFIVGSLINALALGTVIAVVTVVFGLCLYAIDNREQKNDRSNRNGSH